MSKVKFTPEQQEAMRNNQYTARVTENTISFTKEFKELFHEEYTAGSTPREILQKYGYPVDAFGGKRLWGIGHCIKTEYEKYGSFSDVQRVQSEMPALLPAVTPEEQLRQLQGKVDYLSQEVEFLKKISSIKSMRK